MHTSDSSLASLAETATAALSGDRATDDLRKAAECFVSARAHFYTRTGEADWTGRSHAYRQWVRDIYSAAHVPGDELTRVQTAVRYHVNNVLHERLDDEALAALGLRPASARQRSVDQRAQKSDTLRLVEPGAPYTAEELRAASRILADMARRMDSATLRGLRREERAPITESLSIITDALSHAGKDAGNGPKRR
jgi:anti-sigma regulatory factor (Ser/Thr protein kinase)